LHSLRQVLRLLRPSGLWCRKSRLSSFVFEYPSPLVQQITCLNPPPFPFCAKCAVFPQILARPYAGTPSAPLSSFHLFLKISSPLYLYIVFVLFSRDLLDFPRIVNHAFNTLSLLFPSYASFFCLDIHSLGVIFSVTFSAWHPLVGFRIFDPLFFTLSSVSSF